MEEPLQPPDFIIENVPAPPPAPPGRDFVLALAGIFAALTLIAAAAAVEARLAQGQPWSAAAVVLRAPEGMAPPPEALALRAREAGRDKPVPGEEFLDQLKKTALLDEEPEMAKLLTRNELVAAVAMPPEDAAPLLAEGRLPAPGAPEALAGDLARAAPFLLGGREYTVVGRLNPAVAGFAFTYLVFDGPELDAAFPADGKTVHGWVEPKGALAWEGPDAERDGGDGAEADGGGEETLYVNNRARVLPVVFWMTLAGMALAALAGWRLHSLILRALASGTDAMSLRSLAREAGERPRMWRMMHLVMYGAMFLAMLSAARDPLLNYRMVDYVGSLFAEGGLDYIGSAYLSGDVFQAALATFRNNYIDQTLEYTFMISAFGIPFGLAKNLFSFTLAGFVMSPLWTGTAASYVFHTITMVLELEAYILACFAVTVWSVRLFSGFAARDMNRVAAGMRAFFDGVLATGLILAAAALYEAVTLIMMTPGG